MFRKNKYSFNDLKIVFDLAQSFMQEGTNTSLIAAYKLFSKLEENYPDKAFQNNLTETYLKLKELGLIDQVIVDEKSLIKK